MTIRRECTGATGNTASEMSAIAAAQEALDKGITDVGLLIWMQDAIEGAPLGGAPTAAHDLVVTFTPGRAGAMPPALRALLEGPSALTEDAAFWQAWNAAAPGDERRALLYMRALSGGLLESFVTAGDIDEQWSLWCSAALKVSITGGGGSWAWSVKLFLTQLDGQFESD